MIVLAVIALLGAVIAIVGAATGEHNTTYVLPDGTVLVLDVTQKHDMQLPNGSIIEPTVRNEHMVAQALGATVAGLAAFMLIVIWVEKWGI